jgi:hypothetical protein
MLDLFLAVLLAFYALWHVSSSDGSDETAASNGHAVGGVCVSTH